jgi:hypothetical protein
MESPDLLKPIEKNMGISYLNYVVLVISIVISTSLGDD